MAKAQTSAPRSRGPQLYLVTPPIADAADFAARLASALDDDAVAAVLLQLEPADERTLTNRIKALAKPVQDRGAALVLHGHAQLVARAGADGAHLIGLDAFEAEIDRLKPDRIVGAGGLQTRHDAMLAAERGADYVTFGEPQDRLRTLSAVIERVEWWAEVFEIPCVAFAAAPDEIASLAEAGADFVALGDWTWADPRGPAAVIAEAKVLLRAPEIA